MKFRLYYTDNYGSPKTILCEANCFADAEKFGQTMFGKMFVKAEFIEDANPKLKEENTDSAVEGGYMGTNYHYNNDTDSWDTD